MKVVFRADASPRIGTGHVVRCEALAWELRSRGADVAFIARDDDMRKHPDRIDWLVVDHYGLDEKWEAPARSHASRLLVIDDLANRRHDCDVLLDQNFRFDGDDPYRGLVPSSARLLLGPSYALLRPEYAAAAERGRVRDGSVRRLLVSYGGVDASNETMKALAAIETLGLTVDVVIGQANPHRAALERTAARMPDATCHVGLPHLADLMEQADLALGAGGTTTWERLCLGLPSIVTTVADNQLASTQALAAAGCLAYVGRADQVTAETLRSELARQMNDPAALRRQSTRARVLVDGRGAARVADELINGENREARLRAATLEDEGMLLTWANEAEVRRWSFSSEPIALETHRKWLRDKLGDANVRLWILEEGGKAKGQVRCERDGPGVTLNYSIAAEWRGRGLGRTIVRLALEQCVRTWPDRPVTARVKEGNDASVRALQRCGFVELAAARAGTRTFMWPQP